MFTKISEKTEKILLQKSKRNEGWPSNAVICFYKTLQKFYQNYEIMDKSEEAADKILLLDSSQISVGDNEFETLIETLFFMVELCI